jgi:site-specific recombinase XerD
MKQKQDDLKICDVIDRASQYLRTSLHLSEGTIQKHKDNWLYFLEFAVKNGWDHVHPKGYSQFIEYLSRDKPKLLSSERSVLYSSKLLQEYLRSGKILSTKEPLEFHGDIGDRMNEYISEKISEHLRKASIHTYRHQLSRFLGYLSNNRINHIIDIRLEHILFYIRQLPREHKSNIYIAISVVKRFLKWLFDQKILPLNLSIQIPIGRYVQQSSLPAIYTRDEIEQTLKSGVDRGYSTGKRDYLILLLAARLGLRSSDICNLKFDNIQWDKNCILLEQVKTGRMLELPLLADIGNAIIDYLQYGRPQSEEPYILLTASSPYRKMLSSSIFGITCAAFKRAGVNIANKKHGAHALRHSLAARMLEGQTTLPVISEVLGHEKTNSTMYYMRIDINSLSACVLDVVSVKDSFYDQFKWGKQ